MKPYQMVDTRKRVNELWHKGWSAKDIATCLDISRQRVYEHLKILGINPRDPR